MPLPVSVIVPCHNYAPYLPECLDSIIGQTYRPAEIVVVDDASTDPTPHVAASYARHGVRYLRVDLRDPHATRHAGLRATTAPLACCVDADDHIAPDYLERAAPLFRDERVALAWSPVQNFGSQQSRWDPSPIDINRGNYIHAGAVMRRQALDETQAFARPNHATSEDWETWRRILNAGWKAARNPATYFYRRHTGSRSELRPRHLTRLVVAPYLTSAPCPQRGTFTEPNRWDLVAPWCEGIKAQGLEGIILHDGLSAEFVRRLAEYRVEGVAVPPIPATTHANAWRFLQAAEVISQRGATTAFLTDLFDVTIKADPFHLLRTDFDLWIGIETDRIDETTGPGRWMVDKLRKTFGEVDPAVAGQVILNAGIIGGFRAPLLGLLYQLWATLAHRGPQHDSASCMAALNHILYRRHDPARLWLKGAPLHSQFREYDYAAETAIIHK